MYDNLQASLQECEKERERDREKDKMRQTIFEEKEGQKTSVTLLANGTSDKFYVSINNITLFKG